MEYKPKENPLRRNTDGMFNNNFGGFYDIFYLPI